LSSQRTARPAVALRQARGRRAAVGCSRP